MNKLKSITEDKYTLNDVFTRHHELWLFIPPFIYLLTPVIHMITFAFTYKKQEDWSLKDYFHFYDTAELAGDYYSPIIHYAFFIAALITIITVITYIIYSKKAESKIINTDSIPLFFFIAYIILIIISTIHNKTDIKYILGETSRAEGVIQIIGYMLIFYLCASLIKKEKLKQIMIWFFLATSVIIGILTVINKYVTDITIIGDAYVCGIFYTHNFYAYFLTIAITLSAGVAALDNCKAKKITAALIMIFNTFILAVNDSMGPFLSAIVAFIFLFAAVTYKRKKFSFTVLGLFILFLATVFVTGLFTPSFFSEFINLGTDIQKIAENDENAGAAGSARWTLWTHTAQYIKEKPYIGWGLEGTAERLGTETHTDKAHNEYLENMAYFGIPAGLMYLLGLISVYVKALIKRKNIDDTTVICLTGALAYIGSALVGNSFIFTAPFMFIFLGLANNTTGQYKVLEKPAEDNAKELTNSEDIISDEILTEESNTEKQEEPEYTEECSADTEENEAL